MAVTITKSVVDDSDVLSNERVVDMENEIAMLHDDTTQFVTALQRVASKEAHSSKIEWLEDQLFPRLSTLAASATSAAGTIGVATGTGPYFRQGDIIRVATTGEALGVSAAPSTDTVGVVRSVGTVGAASAASGVDLVIIGNASAQGASLGVRAVTKRVAAYNYTQIFRHPYGFTNTLTASELYGGNEPMKERKKKAIEHKRAIENSLFWGARDFYSTGLGGSDAEPTSTMGGLFEYISTNVKDPSGAMDKAEFETFMTAGLQYGTKNKLLFVSPLIASIISGYARDNWVRSRPDDTRWGIQVDAAISGAFGFEVPVVVKRDWNEYQSTSSQYGSWAFLVDMGSVKLRPLRGRNTKLLLNRQGNSDDQTVEEYLTETSFEVQQESKHLLIKNATS
jgi:uncharacterized protein DUF5309